MLTASTHFFPDCNTPQRARGCEGPFNAACGFNYYYYFHLHTNVTYISFKYLSMALNKWVSLEAHQVILPALGCVFRVPLLLWGANCRIHISWVSIAVVAWIISPAPTSPSDSGELKSIQQVDLNLHSKDKHLFHIKMGEYFISVVRVRVKTRPKDDEEDRTHKEKPLWWESGIV